RAAVTCAFDTGPRRQRRVATIRNLIIRIGVTDDRVTIGVKRINHSLDSLADRINRIETLGRVGGLAALAGAAIQLVRAFTPATVALGHLAAAAAPAAGAVLAVPPPLPAPRRAPAPLSPRA